MDQNLTTSSTKFGMTRRLLAGDSLAHFYAKAASFKDDDGVVIEIDENLEASLRAVTGTRMLILYGFVATLYGSVQSRGTREWPIGLKFGDGARTWKFRPPP